MKIERPDWCYSLMPYDLKQEQFDAAEMYFNKWFDTYIEPINKMLSEGVEYRLEKINSKYFLYNAPPDAQGHTHTGMLINIKEKEPIKQDTAEELLKEIRDTMKEWGNATDKDYSARIDALLEKK